MSDGGELELVIGEAKSGMEKSIGHLKADLDPLGMQDQTPHPELDPKSYGFTDADMDRPIFIDNVLGLQTASMREILAIVKRTYCGTFAL